MSYARGCYDYRDDPDIDIKKLVIRLAYVGFVVCGLLYAVGLVIV